ncbi:MAG: cytochrome c3 family protein, partial [Geobacteraceae bacterium]|nr:cytochrome c3 family protein [Geobacteraceae bacterium]
RSNTRYELEFASANVDGVKQRSPMHVFIPAQLAPHEQADATEVEHQCELHADIGVYQGKCDGEVCYFLSVAANQPVTLSVGALKPGVEVPSHLLSEKTGSGAQNSTRKSGGTGFHSDLAGGYFTNYESCRPCHGDFFGPMSHPVDIVPGEGMDVSSELPLLADGRISCMTCHVSHGGNDFYRLRFATKQELCKACHDEY